jgi:crotonobetainyl-CoA:carnitine CoA-transferase CaiB-like acyl-CoA transferase
VRPLEDVAILAVEQYGAGPWGSVHLADLGADVIKIEDPRSGGDVGRYVPPYQDGQDSLFYETFNRNKRSISLDVTTAAGRTVFEDLVRHVDAVYSNLRGDVPAKLRLCYDDLKHLNPAIVCCSLSAYGMTGPRAKDPGYDYILQGLTGWMSLTGEPDAPPQKTGLSLVDFSGGFVAAVALLAGIHAARRDGVGMDCDVSLFDTALSLLSYPATWHLTAGFTPARTRHSAHPSLVPFQNFETADGWIVVGCAKEKFWQRLVDVLDRDELRAPRFATFRDRGEHREELLGMLEQTFRTRTCDEWLAALTAVGVPCGPVNDVAAALRDPQGAAREMLVTTDHPAFGTVTQVASPVRVGQPRRDHRRAPQLDEDASSVLSELLGYHDDHIRSLRAAGAFGEVTPGATREAAE